MSKSDDAKSDEKWRDALNPAQYEICRCGGTEPPFSGKYNDCKTAGTYECVACGCDLFSSQTKYDSGSGWPSFYEGINSDCMTEKKDGMLGMMRTEITCANCDSHLGHVFPDGPKPTGLRYCVNSASLNLRKD